jgi:hypothetical protein
LHGLIAEELLEYLNAGLTEVPVAQRNEEVVLKTGKDDQPASLDLLLLEVLLEHGLEDLDVRPVQVLQVAADDELLQRLRNVERVPLVGRPVGPVLLGIGTRHVHFLLRPWEGLYF